ncbi:MAG: hypothetical protein ACD_16C00103G0003 [uncultured bacterium]|nr:MAG: hypothetical protein ACD_16C00103G0003 [uncultured bacterium]OFX02310.1 MAG: hypothetical protein A2W62_02180 [Alphaproteobacteria bacterium RIFCSPLOWO2_02_42_7]
MAFNKNTFWLLLAGAVILTGCETTTPKSNLSFKTPMSSLKAQKKVSPAVAHAMTLLEQEKYREASLVINQTLQNEPKNVALHLLNAMTYEKLAELGDATGNELAGVGYTNAVNLDPSNYFAVTQLGKLKYREQLFPEAQEHFANALLIRPHDADLWHEFAAASYYAYDIRSALKGIEKAAQLKPDDPLIHRSATMIYAALGDFKSAKGHLAAFKTKAGNDPAVYQVEGRFQDWQRLYQSGRIKLAAATSTSPSGDTTQPPSPPSPSNTTQPPSPSPSNTTQPSTPPASDGTQPPPSDADTSGLPPTSESTEAQAVGQDMAAEFQTPVGTIPPLFTGDDATPSPDGASAAPATGTQGKQVKGKPQVIIDCYLLRIEEVASTTKGNNILENLAVTLTPGGFSTFQARTGGSGIKPRYPDAGEDNTNNIAGLVPSTGFKSNQSPGTQSSAFGPASAFTPQSSNVNLFNKGSMSARIFTAGLTWAGLTYSLNIANSVDTRNEIVSRPSLLTFLNQPATFFSGHELVTGFTGQYGGTLVTYPTGIILEVTPQALEDDMLTLTIGIEGSLLSTPNPDLAETVVVEKSRINTYVKIRLGETLMLGGLYERSEVYSKSGFPGLQDIPVVQYFFSQEQTKSNRISVVFMLTPRSPDAVKTAVNRAMTRQDFRPNLDELSSRTPNWFETHPNLVSAFRYLVKDPVIYYEFRTGDILPPSWGWEPPIASKLALIEGFLYY